MLRSIWSTFRFFIIILILPTNYIFVHKLDNKNIYKKFCSKFLSFLHQKRNLMPGFLRAANCGNNEKIICQDL